MLSAAHFSDSTATDFITESLTVEASKKHRTKKAFYCYLDHFFPYNSNEKFTYYDFSKVFCFLFEKVATSNIAVNIMKH